MQARPDHEPLEVVRAALAAHGCEPGLGASNFRSRCPAHDGDSLTTLSVTDGSDGRVLVHCFKGCAVESVVAAVGLAVRDLFPPGHLLGPRRTLADVRRADLTGRAQPFGKLLAALEQVREPWTGMLGFTCPVCGGLGAWLRDTPDTHGPVLDCSRGCRTEQVVSALAAKVEVQGV